MPALPHAARTALIRVGQVLVTFLLFSLLNAVAVHFEIENGVSILFPATAVAIVACMYFGVWAAIGVVLGTIATPWSPSADLYSLVVSGLVSAAEGMIPYLVFRVWRRQLDADLRDMRSLAVFLVFGTIVNTAFSAIVGNLLIVQHPHGMSLNWREVFVWWIADFTAALILALPALAFGGALLGRAGRPRTIVNTLQIVSVVIVLGFVASFAIRVFLESRIEGERLEQERAWAATHRAASPELRATMERANAKAWADFTEKRRRIVIVTTIVDGCVFLMLVLAAVTLLVNVSRPFAQMRNAIQAMREGGRPDAASIDWRYLEFRALAETLEETGRALELREAELRQQTDRAVAASKHKSDFLAKMSHELRTPLNSIIGFSDLLMEQEGTIDSAKRLAFLDNVQNSARQLLKLINDLLDIAKVEAGKMKMDFEDVDLRLAIANTVASTTPLFVRKHQQVEVSMPDEPMIVRADIGRVEQVLLNLLSNANKFSPDGGKVTVRSEAAENRWRIEVRDGGIGISTDDQERIFEEFEQVYTAGPSSTGTGLGLALAKRFVEAHGGLLEVQSAVGQGSVFRVTLPRA